MMKSDRAIICVEIMKCADQLSM